LDWNGKQSGKRMSMVNGLRKSEISL